jgi:hypothetical protein
MELKLSLFFKRRRDSRRIKSIPQGRKRDGKGIERTNNFLFFYSKSEEVPDSDRLTFGYSRIRLCLSILKLNLWES